MERYIYTHTHTRKQAGDRIFRSKRPDVAWIWWRQFCTEKNRTRQSWYKSHV